MGLFGKSKPAQEIQYFTCTSCGKMVTEDNFNNEMHMCHTCAMVTASFKESFMSTIEAIRNRLTMQKTQIQKYFISSLSSTIFTNTK